MLAALSLLAFSVGFVGGWSACHRRHAAMIRHMEEILKLEEA